MFRTTGIRPESQAPRHALWGSIGAHLGLLLWILHARTPIFVAPSSGLAGVHGEVVTQLYWPAANGAGETAARRPSHDGTTEAPVHLTVSRKMSSRLPQFRVSRTETIATNTHPPESPAEAQAGASAGNPYGSLSTGSEIGHEVRAALPIVTFEPIVDRSQLPGGVEGNCVGPWGNTTSPGNTSNTPRRSGAAW